MKNFLILSSALALVSTGSAFASTDTKAVAPAVVTTVVPSKVVKPTHLPRTFTRSVVDVEFSLDAAGQPRDIRLPSVSDKVLKKAITEAFAQWKFSSAVRQEKGENTRFILPLELIPEV
jgi:hypothetical protein